VRPKKRIRLLLALAPLVIVLAAELAARAAFPPPAVPRVWPPHLARVLHPDPRILPGVSGISRFRINSLGLRGEEPPPTPAYRIVCVGGSTTECQYLDQEEAWPARLEARIRAAGHAVWAGNAGRSGHRTREHRLQVQELVRLEPKPDSIVLLAGVNDLCRRLAADALYDPHAPERAELRSALMADAFAVVPDGPDSPLPFYKQTGLWRLASRVRARLEGDGRGQDERGVVYVRWRERRAARSGLRAELPDLGTALAEFRRNLEVIDATCRASGVRLVIVTHPALWRSDLEPELERLCWMGGIGDYANVDGCEYYSLGALAEGLRRYNAELVAFAAERGLELVDLEAELAKDGSVFYDDVHLNEEGARLAAAAVARHFLEREPFRMGTGRMETGRAGTGD
jgi:lysophospholipase L1-like esterase